MKWNRREIEVAGLLGLLFTLLHLLTSSDSYGIFRDELYYVANGQHLAWGYVDHPPLIGLISWLVTAVFGKSLLALRFLPALAAGFTVVFVCLTTRVMGGERFAQALSGIATGLAPVYLSIFGILSMNAFDFMAWAGIILIAACLLQSGEPRWWIWFGISAGVGLENKISLLFLGFGIVVGLILTRDWKQFSSRWIWIGGAIAFGLFLPFILWQANHDWALLEFMENATQNKILPLTPLAFVKAQVLNMNPLVFPIAVAAFGSYFLTGDGKKFRALGWSCIIILVAMVLQRSKPYYFAPAFPLLFTAGSVTIENLTKKWTWIRPIYMTMIIASGLALAPFAKPILPIETFIHYQAALGMAPSSDERHELGRLPQFFADRIGWRELAETVASVYASLDEHEKEGACIFGQNYGQAGAIDFFGPQLGLPRAISGHNSYWWWGHGGCRGGTVIIIGGEREDHESVFDDLELATTFVCADCMPFENNKPIWIGRNARVGIDDLWPQLRHYD